jgi:hypothetical protein
VRIVFAGFLAAFLASGSLMEVFHHHDLCDDGHAACCANTCGYHLNSPESPVLIAPARARGWMRPASQRVIETLFPKQIFHPPTA